MEKKALALLLTLCMMLSSCPMSVFADDEILAEPVMEEVPAEVPEEAPVEIVPDEIVPDNDSAESSLLVLSQAGEAKIYNDSTSISQKKPLCKNTEYLVHYSQPGLC